MKLILPAPVRLRSVLPRDPASNRQIERIVQRGGEALAEKWEEADLQEIGADRDQARNSDSVSSNHRHTFRQSRERHADAPPLAPRQGNAVNEI